MPSSCPIVTDSGDQDINIFQGDLVPVNFRVLMSCHRKNSLRDKVIGNKQIYLKTHPSDRVWVISEAERS